MASGMDDAGAKRAIRIGLLGLGTVGGGTVQLLHRNRAELQRRIGRDITVCCAAVRDPERQRTCPTAGLRLYTDPLEVVRDPDVDVVVELMGGVESAGAAVQAAIESGKHVVTANKALIAERGNELFDAARRHAVMIGFEAAVAGGIPIIKVLREGLAGNRIESLVGIINGTCNYVLGAMDQEGADFDAALQAAQRCGYAEADPQTDVDGTDAAHKLTILAALAYGIPLQLSRVHREGITAISPVDIACARELGYCIKHLGVARRREDGIELRVHPALLPQQHILASVRGVMNAVLLCGNAVGDTLYYGPGAGAEPTASAVLADLLDIARAMSARTGQQVPSLAFQPDALLDTPIVPAAMTRTGYYLRMQVDDKPGVLARVAGSFGESGISIEVVQQKAAEPGARRVALVLLTQCVAQGDLEQALVRIRQLDAVDRSIVRIRIEAMNSATDMHSAISCAPG